MTLRRALHRRIPTPRAVDDPRWMALISTLSDTELDELLEGHTPDGRGELSPLADVAIAVRRRTAVERAPKMTYPLRQAVAQRAAPVTPRRPSLVPVAVGAFGIAGLMLAGAANALPAPIQNVVSDAGGLVGVAIPQADDDVVDTRDGGDGPTSNAGSSGEGDGPEAKGGPPESTPGGATPADPGTPGDHEPATPAIPPEQSNGGNTNGTGQGSGNSQGDANANAHTDGGTGQDNGKDKAPADDGGESDDETDDGQTDG